MTAGSSPPGAAGNFPRWPGPASATAGDYDYEQQGSCAAARWRSTSPIPLDCADGSAEAHYGRPEQFLDPAARRPQSAWGFVDPADAERGLQRLRGDLASGRWDERHGYLCTQPEFDGALRLIIADTPG